MTGALKLTRARARLQSMRGSKLFWLSAKSHDLCLSWACTELRHHAGATMKSALNISFLNHTEETTSFQVFRKASMQTRHDGNPIKVSHPRQRFLCMARGRPIPRPIGKRSKGKAERGSNTSQKTLRDQRKDASSVPGTREDNEETELETYSQRYLTMPRSLQRHPATS